jgi:hypothetical protein
MTGTKRMLWRLVLWRIEGRVAAGHKVRREVEHSELSRAGSGLVDLICNRGKPLE